MKITATVRGITVHRKGYKEHWKVENNYMNIITCGIMMFLKTFFKVKTTPEHLIEKSLKEQMEENEKK